MRKCAVFLLLLTLTVNALSAFSVLETDADLSSSDLLNSALCAESSLISVMMLSALPVDIVTSLVRENGLLSPVLQKRHPVRKSNEEKRRNASADAALGTEPVNSIVRSIGKICCGDTVLFHPGENTGRVPPVIFPVDVAAEPGNTLVIFLLVYLVVLAMSNLPSDLINANNPYNRAIPSSGFFIWGELS